MARPDLTGTATEAVAQNKLNTPQGEVARLVDTLITETNILAEAWVGHKHKIEPIVRQEPVQESDRGVYGASTLLGGQLVEAIDRIRLVSGSIYETSDKVEL